MYKAVVFDVDGTMVDTEDAVAEAKLKILAEKGRTMDRSEMLKKIWGKPRYKSFELLGIEDTEENHDKMTRYMLEFSSLIRFYDGIKETVRKLHDAGIKLGIVTSRIREELGYDMEPSGLVNLFDITVCYEDTAEHKPHPEPLQLFLQKSGLAADQVLFIGDTVYDMQCAAAAGVDFGLALWGTTEPDTLNGEFRLEHPSEILVACLGYNIA
ncbi:MAG TPA: HAD family hydrolase [Anseongella sp.]|nr:HAD family hydrolase [Anseongella sp.]